ncbi:MAG: Glycosyl transferase, family 2 [Candidatus Woesebacteria bacterium GW2011_GWA1_37_8]|uniref:Glycosyl transferase, family 2 n=1 Tax=Candidatus Woesebacteria bacterium GW2011_GWA1_37_8 TaxID=1618546 RepID=A0A0G0HZU1_9BACT|nr:MAG: Glycosyl transferase, family 2 [Candidatus Woesebacteria bacterium GW2011_GWA1_37_8]
MYRNKKISVVIPCYNEEIGLEKTYKLIPKFIDEVLVVDNLSTDKTAKVAKKLGAKVISEKNKGYGFAIKKGIETAKADIIITIDGDGTYPVEDSLRPVKYLLDENLDFVSCSRFPLRNRNSMHWQNLVGNKLISFLMKLLFWREFKDGLSGMWVFRKNIYNSLLPLSSDWNLSEEIKIKAYLHPDIKFDEYRINYHPRFGASKVWPIKVGIENIVFLFKFRMHNTLNLEKST